MIQSHGPEAAKKSDAVKPASRPAPKVRPGAAEPRDTIEISVAARLAAKLREPPDVRADLVDRIKAEIKAGTYETDEKLDAALDKLMEERFLDP